MPKSSEIRGAVGRNQRGKKITFFIMPGKGNVRKENEFWVCVRHTSFPFGEGYVTSRFILDKFDLDLSSSGLLVRFGLLLVVVVVSCAVYCFVIIDERVVAYRGRAG